MDFLLAVLWCPEMDLDVDMDTRYKDMVTELNENWKMVTETGVNTGHLTFRIGILIQSVTFVFSTYLSKYILFLTFL